MLFLTKVVQEADAGSLAFLLWGVPYLHVFLTEACIWLRSPLLLKMLLLAGIDINAKNLLSAVALEGNKEMLTALRDAKICDRIRLGGDSALDRFLHKKKHNMFPHLSKDEVASLEAILREIPRVCVSFSSVSK